VAGDLETVLLGDGRADAVQLGAVEFDEPVAALAIQVVVAGVAVFVLEDAPRAQREFADQARLDQFAERAIDRRAAEFPFGQKWAEVFEQFVGVEMVMMAEDLLDDQPPLFRQPFAAAFEELAETLDRRGGHVDRPEGKAFRHGAPEEGRKSKLEGRKKVEIRRTNTQDESVSVFRPSTFGFLSSLELRPSTFCI
jgi:hypothetical protein